MGKAVCSRCGKQDCSHCPECGACYPRDGAHAGWCSKRVDWCNTCGRMHRAGKRC